MIICLATNNSHKIEEIKQVLGTAHEVRTLKEIGCNEELPETGDTLEANSLQKASYIYEKYHMQCIADDSGLEILELSGKPGVDSAHYAGPQRNADDNMQKVLLELDQISAKHRQALFKTVITYINTQGVAQQFVGMVEGVILNEKRGSQGFGYDPIFLPNGSERTFAEMSATEKNALSHRAKALEKFQAFLSQMP